MSVEHKIQMQKQTHGELNCNRKKEDGMRRAKKTTHIIGPSSEEASHVRGYIPLFHVGVANSYCHTLCSFAIRAFKARMILCQSRERSHLLSTEGDGNFRRLSAQKASISPWLGSDLAAVEVTCVHTCGN